MHIFWSTSTSLNLEHSNSSLHHLVDEADGLQVLRAHDIFVVYFELVACLVVGNGI